MNIKTNGQYKHLLGLIGLPLAHSFSKKYFSDKFENEELEDYFYDLFPITSPYFLNILKQDNENLLGLNVTIPYKETVIPFMDEVEESAAKVGAVNTILIKEGKMIGYNTDVIGFSQELQVFIKESNLKINKALILGTGGASKAIQYVLDKFNIASQRVSRNPVAGVLGYDQLDATVMDTHQLIVNTTPLGTFPKEDKCPDIPYDLLTKDHAVFDLVYNPEKTLLLSRAEHQGAACKNGLGMLHAQAEASWNIWKE